METGQTEFIPLMTGECLQMRARQEPRKALMVRRQRCRPHPTLEGRRKKTDSIGRLLALSRESKHMASIELLMMRTSLGNQIKS